LDLARRALTLTRFQIAQLLGTNMATWGTYEAGLVRIPPEQARKLCAYGVPLDWIYGGTTTGLHPDNREKFVQSGTDRRSRHARPTKFS
jgi:hypothetical protein